MIKNYGPKNPPPHTVVEMSVSDPEPMMRFELAQNYFIRKKVKADFRPTDCAIKEVV